MDSLKEKVRKHLVRHYDIFKTSAKTEEVRADIEKAISEIIDREYLIVSLEERKKVASEILDEVVGFGPLKSLLEDPAITEIMVNGPHQIYTEKKGKMELSSIKFDDEQQLYNVIHKIVSPTHRRVDESTPYVDLSLADGSRVNIILPPLSLVGPVVTIRKFLQQLRSMDDLVKLDTMTKEMAEFLIACARSKINIIFAGATGAGKTTTLNILSSYISKDERIVTIEDTAELRLQQQHVVRLETRQANIEGKGDISIRDLFINSLRMRPDRIILGEIRSAEALDLLQAITSGHAGSLSVIHANSPADVVTRLETMVLSSGVPLPQWVVRKQIGTALDLIVQNVQLPDGSRKIVNITEVCNELQNDEIALKDIFRFELEDIDAKGEVHGKWKTTGVIPSFYSSFKRYGVNISERVFKEN